MSTAIILGFAALLLLLLLALLWSHWPAWLKGLLVCAVSVFYFFGHEAVREIWGVPSHEPVPERFIMLAAVVDEPTSRTSGWIYMWVSEIVEGRSGLSPKAYRLHYSKEMHTQVDEGLKRSKDGVSQIGTAEVKTGQKKGFALLQPGSDEQEIKIRDMPSPQLPEK